MIPNEKNLSKRQVEFLYTIQKIWQLQEDGSFERGHDFHYYITQNLKKSQVHAWDNGRADLLVHVIGCRLPLR